MTATARPALVAVAAVLLVGASAAGAPRWDTQLQLSAGDRAIGPELALDPAGEALVVWNQEVGAVCPSQPAALECVHVVQATTRSADSQTWRSPLEISRPGVGSRPTAALAASGDAAILWVHDIGRDRVLQASFRNGLAGTFPEPNDLSEAKLEIRSHRITLDAGGNAVAVWAERPEGTSFDAMAVVRPRATGAWSSAVRLSSPEWRVASGPELALAASGRATVAWIDGNDTVWVSYGDARAGAWTPRAALSNSSGGRKRGVAIATNSSGETAVVWARGDPASAESTVQAVYRSREGVWTQPVDIGSVRSEGADDLQVAMGADGVCIAMWAGRGGVVHAIARGPTGPWGVDQELSRPEIDVSSPRVALDGRGNAVAVWVGGPNRLVQSAIRPAASAMWQPPTLVSRPGASIPAVAATTAGDALAVWNETQGTRVAVVAAKLVGTGPVMQRLRTPPRLARGIRGSFAVDVVPWASPLAGRPRWRFGDGGTAVGTRVVHRYARYGRYVVVVGQADDAGGSTTATATVVVGAPRVTKRPSIQGKPLPPATLTCLPGSWTGAAPIRLGYTWLRDGHAIPGATASRYRLRVRDLGEKIGCRVRATNSLGSTAANARQVFVTVGA